MQTTANNINKVIYIIGVGILTAASTLFLLILIKGILSSLYSEAYVSNNTRDNTCHSTVYFESYTTNISDNTKDNTRHSTVIIDDSDLTRFYSSMGYSSLKAGKDK